MGEKRGKTQVKSKLLFQKAGFTCIGITIVSLFVNSFFQNIFFLGFSFALLGLSILLFLLAKRAVIKTGAIIASCYFIIFGLLIAFSEMIGDYFHMGDMFIKYVMCFGMGGIFLGTFLMNLVKVFVCRTKVMAVYQGAERMKVKAFTGYVPRFHYTYKENNYDNTTGELYSHRKLERKFQIGKSYEIYTSEKNPYVIYTHRKLKGNDLLLLIFGVLFVLVAFR